MLGWRNLLGRCATDTIDSNANFFADLFVCLYGLLLITNSFTREFVAGLGHAKLVGRHFGGVHTIQQLLFGRDILFRFDGVAI